MVDDFTIPGDQADEIDRSPRTRSIPRELETREAEVRAEYVPPSALPDPKPQDGIVYRWIRVGSVGQGDKKNVSQRFREGWEPVRAEDHPELFIMPESTSGLVQADFPGTIEIGGLMLCKMPVEKARARTAYYDKHARNQMESVDHSYLREEVKGGRNMRLFSEQSTETKFGTGSKPT